MYWLLSIMRPNTGFRKMECHWIDLKLEKLWALNFHFWKLPAPLNPVWKTLLYQIINSNILYFCHSFLRSDINAADTDGWTPLHCAASCNNLSMAKFLVENGACIFAVTISDGETAADKCEELDDGFIQCSEYLYGIQVWENKLF